MESFFATYFQPIIFLRTSCKHYWSWDQGSSSSIRLRKEQTQVFLKGLLKWPCLYVGGFHLCIMIILIIFQLPPGPHPYPMVGLMLFHFLLLYLPQPPLPQIILILIHFHNCVTIKKVETFYVVFPIFFFALSLLQLHLHTPGFMKTVLSTYSVLRGIVCIKECTPKKPFSRCNIDILFSLNQRTMFPWTIVVFIYLLTTDQSYYLTFPLHCTQWTRWFWGKQHAVSDVFKYISSSFCIFPLIRWCCFVCSGKVIPCP